MDKARRDHFVSWFTATYGESKSEGARAKFMADTGRHGYKSITKGRVAQYFDEKQSFGELAAKQLAARLGFAEDFFLVSSPREPVLTASGSKQPPVDIASRRGPLSPKLMKRIGELDEELIPGLELVIEAHLKAVEPKSIKRKRQRS